MRRRNSSSGLAKWVRSAVACAGGVVALLAGMQAPQAVADESPPSPLIIGGHDASETYPFMASLRHNGEFGCGAALIEPQWVITAAHCVAGANAEEHTVRVGSHDRTIGGTEARVSRAIVHPEYNGQPGGDLALLQLDRRVNYQPIDIAADSGGPDTATRILGWGTTCDPALDESCNPRSGSPVQLQELDTTLVEDQRCVGFDGQTELCTDSSTPNAQACFGDSGGPQIKGRPGAWQLIGATSRDGDGDPACSTGTGIWTDLTAYTDWIDNAIESQSPADVR